jgi:hypothetical protein
MTSRPACLQLVDEYVAGSTIAHEYVFGLEERVAKLAPEFAVLRERHKQIVSKLLDLLRQTR